MNSLTLAHQGGWDEILMVAGPVLIFAWLLSVARKRAQTLADAEAVDSPSRAHRECLTPFVVWLWSIWRACMMG